MTRRRGIGCDHPLRGRGGAELTVILEVLAAQNVERSTSARVAASIRRWPPSTRASGPGVDQRLRRAFGHRSDWRASARAPGTDRAAKGTCPWRSSSSCLRAPTRSCRAVLGELDRLESGLARLAKAPPAVNFGKAGVIADQHDLGLAVDANRISRSSSRVPIMAASSTTTTVRVGQRGGSRFVAHGQKTIWPGSSRRCRPPPFLEAGGGPG